MKALRFMMKLFPHMSLPRKNKGFTLIEVLLALTIFAFIGIGIATSFFSGVKLWQRATTSGVWRNDIILGLEAVSKELRQSIDMPEIGFEGDVKSFSFPSISGSKIIKVVYSFDSAGKVLKRNEKDVLSLDEFSVQYMRFDLKAGDVEWTDSWKKEDGIFTAIRFKGKSHDEEFTRTVFIPVS